MHTIRNIILANNFNLSNTVYDEKSMLDYPIYYGDYWDLKQMKLDSKSYQKLYDYRMVRDEMVPEEKVEELELRMKALTLQSRKLFRQGLLESPEFEQVSREKVEARNERNTLLEKGSQMALQKVFGEGARPEKVLAVRFAETEYAFDFGEVACLIPAWQGAEYASFQERPWFTKKLSALKKLLSSGRPVGIEGGACLFGTDEMRFHFTMMDGSRRSFDFNTMQEILPGRSFKIGTTPELRDFCLMKGREIVGAQVDCPKNGITRDEYEAICFLFLTARALPSKTVVTIPDLSYDKTFIALFSFLPREIYEPFHRGFLENCQRMTKKSVQMIHALAKRFEYKDYEIFYSGNERLCREFHEKRRPFLEAATDRFMTTRDWMREAISDYTTMPAMPFYLYGLTDVLEVNQLTECTSIVKCRKLHRDTINLCDMLYPMSVGRNGKTSSFHAPIQEKEYIDEAVFS